jgi:two-component system, NarL family, nitrate/nitrite response regulator NarL
MWQSRAMKLLVVDDHPLFRDGLAALLRQANPDTQVFQASDSEAGMEMALATGDLDAVFVDLMMPGLAGEAAVKEFARRRPELPVIVLSSSENPSDVKRVLNAGALGYIPKSASAQTVLSALQLVLTGNIYVPPLLARAVDSTATEQNTTVPAPLATLTERQLEVLKQLRDGHPNKEISNRLGIAEKTVKAHVAAIFRALNVVNRTQAANAARELQL